MKDIIGKDKAWKGKARKIKAEDKMLRRVRKRIDNLISGDNLFSPSDSMKHIIEDREERKSTKKTG